MTFFDWVKFCVPLSCGIGVAKIVVAHLGMSYPHVHRYEAVSFSVTFLLVFGLWKCYTEISHYRYKKQQREQEQLGKQ